jgi:hypothetical protein
MKATSQRKKLALLSIAATAVISGMLLPVGPTSRAMVLLAEVPAFVAWTLLYIWYKADVAQRSVATSTTFNGLVIALSWLALPGYFLRSRGLLGGVLSTVLFYSGVVLWALLAAITAWVRNAASAT